MLNGSPIGTLECARVESPKGEMLFLETYRKPEGVHYSSSLTLAPILCPSDNLQACTGPGLFTQRSQMLRDTKCQYDFPNLLSSKPKFF